MARQTALGECLVGAGTLGLGVVILWQTAQAPLSPIYAKVGPAMAPYGIGAGLGLLGAALLLKGLRGGWRSEEDRAAVGALHLRPFLWMLLGLLCNAFLIGWLGFILSSTILFVCTARAFGSKKFLRDGAIAFVLCALVYFAFSKGLGISLGAGLLESQLP